VRLAVFSTTVGTPGVDAGGDRVTISFEADLYVRTFIDSGAN
jgi:hypothetical protein